MSLKIVLGLSVACAAGFLLGSMTDGRPQESSEARPGGQPLQAQDVHLSNSVGQSRLIDELRARVAEQETAIASLQNEIRALQNPSDPADEADTFDGARQDYRERLYALATLDADELREKAQQAVSTDTGFSRLLSRLHASDAETFLTLSWDARVETLARHGVNLSAEQAEEGREAFRRGWMSFREWAVTEHREQIERASSPEDLNTVRLQWTIQFSRTYGLVQNQAVGILRDAGESDEKIYSIAQFL